MARMPEIVDPVVASVICLRLRDFVVMMRELQVNPTTVDINRELVKNSCSHCRALDVPAGTALTPRTLPRRFFGLGSLPQGEVALTLFVLSSSFIKISLTLHSSLTRSSSTRVQLRILMLRVLNELLHVKVHRSIGLIRKPVINDLLDEVTDFNNIF